MSLEAVRTMIVRHRAVALGIGVVVLAAVAALLAVSVIGQARELTAGSGASASPEPSPSVAPSEEPPATPEPTLAPTPEPTPVPTPGPIAEWELAATFGGNGQSQMGVHSAAAWNGFVAIGEAWQYDDLGGRPDPRLWRSLDGAEWWEVPIELGAGASVQEVTPMADGSLLILGTIGGDVSYWSDPAVAAAWTSADAVTWTPLDLPFAANPLAAPIRFAAGPEGIVATVDNDIWYSADGLTWGHAYEVARGSVLYEPVAGDQGWIVKRSNASLGTVTLLVSGDAVTWYEIDLGNVGTVSSVAGDWLATRHSDDWLRTEVLRSENGLDWQTLVDVGSLPSDSESGAYDGATLTGTDDVLFLSPWQAGHCYSMQTGEEVFWSSDGSTWVSAGLTDGAVVTHAVEVGEVSILTGYIAGSGGVAFWVSTR